MNNRTLSILPGRTGSITTYRELEIRQSPNRSKDGTESFFVHSAGKSMTIEEFVKHMSFMVSHRREIDPNDSPLFELLVKHLSK